MNKSVFHPPTLGEGVIFTAADRSLHRATVRGIDLSNLFTPTLELFGGDCDGEVHTAHGGFDSTAQRPNSWHRPSTR